MIQYRAMQYYNWNLLEEEPLNPLLGRKTIHGQNVTVARIRLRKGAVVPMHRHPSEQISMLESGTLRFTAHDTIPRNAVLQLEPAGGGAAQSAARPQDDPRAERDRRSSCGRAA